MTSTPPGPCRGGVSMAAIGKYHEWLTPDGLLRIEGWARDGLTDLQIAHNIGVGERTFTRWKGEHETIAAALKKGKQPVDTEVENALLKRALGYTYTETVVEEGPDGVKTRTYQKHMPADVTAQIYWLKNRKPDIWRDKREVEAGLQTLESAKAILGGVRSAIE